MDQNGRGIFESMVQVWLPGTAEEAWQLKRRFGDSGIYAAGSTWLRTRWESGAAAMAPHLISLESIAELRAVEAFEAEGEPGGRLRIGAAVTLAAVSEREDIGRLAPLLGIAVRSVAAPSVRRLATLGGNVMTGSGDMAAALLALDAVIVLYSQGRYERQPLAEWLAADKRDASALTIGFELLDTSYRRCWYRKIGRREAFSPSVVAVACSYKPDDGRGTLSEVRIAVTGAGMQPIRLYEAETAAERGALCAEVYKAARIGIPSVSDDYAGASYRRMAAANIIAAELDRAAAAFKEGEADAGETVIGREGK